MQRILLRKLLGLISTNRRNSGSPTMRHSLLNLELQPPPPLTKRSLGHQILTSMSSTSRCIGKHKTSVRVKCNLQTPQCHCPSSNASTASAFTSTWHCRPVRKSLSHSNMVVWAQIRRRRRLNRSRNNSKNSTIPRTSAISTKKWQSCLRHSQLTLWPLMQLISYWQEKSLAMARHFP